MRHVPRTLIDVRNEIIRVRGNLEAINRPPFTDEDRAILAPRYSALLHRLEKEEQDHRNLLNTPSN